MKKCEPFTMKHKLLFIEFTNGSYLEPRSWIPHDFGGFFLFFHRFHVVVMGGYSLVMEEIMVIRGGYFLPRVDLYTDSS
jgi:hypothetical protein